MKTNKTKLAFSFFLAIVAAIWCSAIFPKLNIIAFAPLLVIFYLYTPFFVSIWVAMICGVFIDLISSTPFGLNSLNYAITTFLVFRYRRFFNDKPLNISIYTALTSCVISLISIILLALISKGISICLLSIITDIIIMPIVDGIYAFIWFAIPLKIYEIFEFSLKRFIRKKR